MASAVASPSSALPHPWLSPRLTNPDPPRGAPPPPPPPPASSSTAETDFIEFEFPSEEDRAKNKMLSADELFSNGKLLPLKPHSADVSISGDVLPPPEAVKPRQLSSAIAVDSDPYVFSPKAPSCSSRWRELLGLRKSQNSPNPKDSSQKQPSSLSKSSNPNSTTNPARSLKYFVHRNSRSDSALSLPLLHRDSDADSSVCASARLSLSSSSSSDRSSDDLNPRLSLDSDRTATRVQQIRARLDAARARSGRSPARRPPSAAGSAPPAGSPAPAVRDLSVDSPRMNASGKIVFQGLERSSSSPGSFNGGPRPVRSRNGMERSYSANVVRVTPVLNVPVCSLSKPGSVFGFFSPVKKDGNGLGQGRSGLVRTGSKVKAVRD